MKRLITYLLIFAGICLMASNDGIADIIDVKFCSDSYRSSYIESDNEYTLDSPEYCFDLPRTSSIAGRTQTSVQIRRPAGGNSQNQTFLKSGKLINRTTTRTFRNHIDKFPSGFTETTHRLISLGKLVI